VQGLVPLLQERVKLNKRIFFSIRFII
jgi:hypothetical protein